MTAFKLLKRGTEDYENYLLREKKASFAIETKRWQALTERQENDIKEKYELFLANELAAHTQDPAEYSAQIAYEIRNRGLSLGYIQGQTKFSRLDRISTWALEGEAMTIEEKGERAKL